MIKKTVFISYSQKDKERVSLFASLMAKNGFDIWMDVKNISLGESIISAIAEALNNVDIYMLFISHNSSESPWVTEELNIALTSLELSLYYWMTATFRRLCQDVYTWMPANQFKVP